MGELILFSIVWLLLGIGGVWAMALYSGELQRVDLLAIFVGPIILIMFGGLLILESKFMEKVIWKRSVR